MTGNGRHMAGIFSRFSPRHSWFIPGYENSQFDQNNLGKLCIIPSQTRKTYVLDQFLDQESFPVLSLIVLVHIERDAAEELGMGNYIDRCTEGKLCAIVPLSSSVNGLFTLP